ncbi:replication initiation negative regulator SeqA [Zophobihabitans entericus]|uniref:Negative modulator of initiation of replication n=1 Tax=Zophobihabitans entericus TaxID=1635327 RepID=A0A6G9IDK3_9GAMM|nr:replication initiation negative regulator SeqA [Zophobihabitans entericus]QIQ21784.1 replication initiation negative regulator SeqA [Zophobihabitans entericus]
MKTIEIDDELYHYIASQTQHIGESASSILRRLLKCETTTVPSMVVANVASQTSIKLPATSLLSLIHHSNYIDEKKTVNRFLMLLSALYQENSSRFSLAATSLHGSKRRYLATDEKSLIDTGNNTKPKAIPDTPYWVVTNNNSARKSYILKTIMDNMELSPSIITTVLDNFIAKAGE